MAILDAADDTAATGGSHSKANIAALRATGSLPPAAGPQMRLTWTGALLLAVLGEAGFALVVRTAELRHFLQGDRSVAAVVSVVGLGWLLVLLIVAAGAGRSLLTAHARVARGAQALTGVAATSREWVWEADAEMRLTYSNDRVQELLGYDPAALLGIALPSLVADNDSKSARGLLASALIDRAGWHDVELHWRHADGHTVALQGSAVPIVDAVGTIVGFRGSRRAVTVELSQQRSLAAARARLDQVIAEGAIDIALQPIVDLACGRVVGVEALARFRDVRGPDVWFSEAHDTGQSLDLDLLAFRTALTAFPLLPEEVYLSVNATPALLTDRRLQDTLLGSGLPLDRLVIEITEHVEIFRYDEINTALIPLRESGVRLAIDDTGAGYASFSHVLQLRPDVIKIDRSLVTGVDRDPARRSLISALVLLALELGAAVTGEGVEETGELETLHELGVDHAQGYLLAPPTTERAEWAPWWTREWTPLHGLTRPPVRLPAGGHGT
jgi:PAS domain S-box-containing protein